MPDFGRIDGVFIHVVAPGVITAQRQPTKLSDIRRPPDTEIEGPLSGVRQFVVDAYWRDKSRQVLRIEMCVFGIEVTDSCLNHDCTRRRHDEFKLGSFHFRFRGVAKLWRYIVEDRKLNVLVVIQECRRGQAEPLS